MTPDNSNVNTEDGSVNSMSTHEPAVPVGDASEERAQVAELVLDVVGDYADPKYEDYFPGVKQTIDSIMQLFAAQVASHQASLEQIIGWIERNHIQPENDTDRWVQASREIKWHIEQELAKLQHQEITIPNKDAYKLSQPQDLTDHATDSTPASDLLASNAQLQRQKEGKEE